MLPAEKHGVDSDRDIINLNSNPNFKMGFSADAF